MEKFVWKKGTKPKDPMNRMTSEHNTREELSHKTRETVYSYGYQHELPRTEKQEQVTRLVISVFKEHMHRLGIDVQKELSTRQFHFFDRAGFDREFPDLKGAFGGHGGYDTIPVVAEESEGQFFLTLLHEAAHAFAIHTYELGTEGRLPEYRNGYTVMDRKSSFVDPRRDKMHFNAFNEGVVEMTALRLAARYEDLFWNAGVSSEGLRDAMEHHAYVQQVSVVVKIISKLAVVYGEDELETWKRIERGQYTGDMMWMRSIEKVFGKGALRVLDCLSTEESEEAYQRNAMVLEYFSSDDAAKREGIQEQLY